MKPAPFEYARAGSVDEAVAMLADAGSEARVIAGGQTLGPMLNLRLASPTRLVDVRAIAALSRIDVGADTLRLGACVTHAKLEDRARATPLDALLAFVASAIAFRAIRNRGTVGGSLAHADPAADWPAVMTLLEARLHICAPAGRRQVAMADFMHGAFSTAIGSGELLESVELPVLPAGTRWGYHKISRKQGEFPEAIGAAVLDTQRTRCRIVVGAIDGAPALLPGLAERVQREGAAAASLDSVAHEVRSAAPNLDAVDIQLHAVAVRRAILQALAP